MSKDSIEKQQNNDQCDGMGLAVVKTLFYDYFVGGLPSDPAVSGPLGRCKLDHPMALVIVDNIITIIDENYLLQIPFCKSLLCMLVI